MRPFLKALGSLPRTVPALALTVVAGLGEGFGLALFLPLMERLTGGDSGIARSVPVVGPWLEALGLVSSPLVMIAMVLVAVSGSFALAWARDITILRAKFAFIAQRRTALLDALLHARWSHMARQSSGDTVNLLLTECHRAGNALASQISLLGTLFQILVYLALGVLMSWQLLLLSTALLILVAVVVRPLMRRTGLLGEASTTANQEYSHRLVDLLRGLRLIRVTAAEAMISARMASLADRVSHVFAEGEITTATAYFITQLLPVVVFAGLLAVATGGLGVDLPILLGMLLILSRLAPRLAQLQQQYQSCLINLAALVPLERLLTETLAAREDTGAGQREEFHRLVEGISFRAVTYRYEPEGAAVLDKIDLAIGRNQMVGIVGRSGAGKSTIIDLLAGLRSPTHGEILVDGRPLASLDMLSWRWRLGYVTQDLMLFNDTLRNNLLLGRNYPQQDIEDAIAAADLTEVISTLPDGLDTITGEGGIRLSGGQRQRVALARALLGKPDVLLLDEATSALDNESERTVLKAIEGLRDKLAVVIVAHRLSTVRKADVIYLLDRGVVAETGTYESLAAKGGQFSQLIGAADRGERGAP
ncbi:ABC transporter ATP-binding protein [Magnetospirillum sulfuroxidans]|uniref:ABC transporter ATP-binding protein n=1 Tax=Magnetospirillum sulfuroxidans TaxID=611300 RepID=A0ABS5IJ57_9PROT|nr:ABC transporter ATP-binding protein [Magnetospirillum sulfuroxidans]MBR9973743.1 ABC transporter ATP-binding protein [Magnetospirillum sulfuroxidans]